MKKIARRVYEASSDVNIWCTRLLQQIYENQDKINEMVDEVNTCYSIILKIQDWIVKHEKLVKLTMQEAVRLMEKDMKNATKAKTTNSTGKIT